MTHRRPKKHKSVDSGEDDEEPRNEPGTSQLAVPVLPHNPGDEDSECSDENSAQSRDSEKALYYPDLCVLTDDEHWTKTLQTHKYAAAAGSFCFSMSENGDQQDMCNLISGFQEKQKEYLQIDFPASTRPGFRMSCQMAASKGWDLFHIDLKTAFLQ